MGSGSGRNLSVQMTLFDTGTGAKAMEQRRKFSVSKWLCALTLAGFCAACGGSRGFAASGASPRGTQFAHSISCSFMVALTRAFLLFS